MDYIRQLFYIIITHDKILTVHITILYFLTCFLKKISIDNTIIMVLSVKAKRDWLNNPVFVLQNIRLYSGGDYNMSTKYCVGCDTVKSVDDFYFHYESGKPEKFCKPCKLKRQKQYKRRLAKISGVPHEQDIIDKLKSMGIYACSGKKSRSRWVDIVAFGCVAIEAKLASTKNKGKSWLFTFTLKQVREGIRGDVVVLMTDYEGTVDYYILRSNDPVLYDMDGQLKRFMSYTPSSNHANRSLDMMETMDNARGNWGVITDVFNEKLKRLKRGQDVDLWATT